MNEISHADHAQMILENPAFKDAFKMLEQAYKDSMAATAPEEREERDRWHICLFVLNDVKTALTACVENGKITAFNNAKREKIKHD